MNPELSRINVPKYTFKQRFILKAAPVLAGGLVKALYSTSRMTEVGMEHWTKLESSNTPFIIPLWHEAVAVLLPKFAGAKIHALTSLSFDGALAAALLDQFGVGALRGSSSKGGHAALAQMIKMAPNVKAIAMTVDGPRGPRRIAKHGAAALSFHTQLPILPLAGAATKSIRLRSWDRTVVPKPFGEYIYSVSAPLAPTASEDRDCIAAKTLEIQTTLNALHEAIETEYGMDPEI